MRINGVDYRVPELGFNTICELEDKGISIYDIISPKVLRKKYMTIIRAFTGLATGLEPEETSFLIEKHLLSGGTMEGWLDEIIESVEKSDFFQKLVNRKNPKTPQDHKKKITKIPAEEETE